MNIEKWNLNKYIKKIFILAWPVMLGMILQSLLGTIDLFFIAKLGKSEAAAASLGNSASGVIFVMSSLIAAGAVALVARYFGEGNNEAIKRISGESILLSVIFGGILSIVCYKNTDLIIKVMYNTKPEMTNLTSEYLEIVFMSTIIVFLNSTIRTILHALGDTRTPLYIFGASNIINIILDPLFIFTLGLGIKGAAIATVIARIISFIIVSYVLIKRLYESSIKCFLSYINLKFKESIRILRIGIWDCIQQIARPITGMLMYRIIYEVGNDQGTAAFGIGGQLFSYTFIFLAGLSVAISIMVGQSLGRNDLEDTDDIIKEGLKLATINMIVFSIPYLIFPKFIIGIFISDPGVIGVGATYLRIVYLGIAFVIFQVIYGGAFKGAGDTLPPMIASLVANVTIKLPLAYILAIYFNMGTNGVWIAVAISILIEALIIIGYFKKGKWKEKKL